MRYGFKKLWRCECHAYGETCSSHWRRVSERIGNSLLRCYPWEGLQKLQNMDWTVAPGKCQHWLAACAHQCAILYTTLTICITSTFLFSVADSSPARFSYKALECRDAFSLFSFYFYKGLRFPQVSWKFSFFYLVNTFANVRLVFKTLVISNNSSNFPFQA